MSTDIVGSCRLVHLRLEVDHGERQLGQGAGLVRQRDRVLEPSRRPGHRRRRRGGVLGRARGGAWRPGGRRAPLSSPRRRRLGTVRAGDDAVIDIGGLDRLIVLLGERGYRTVGPVARDGAIVHGEVRGADDLPAGWPDVQAPGRSTGFPRGVTPRSSAGRSVRPRGSPSSSSRRRPCGGQRSPPAASPCSCHLHPSGRWPSSAPGRVSWRRSTCWTGSWPAARCPTTATRPAEPVVRRRRGMWEALVHLLLHVHGHRPRRGAGV